MAPSDNLGEFIAAAKAKGLDDASIVALLKQNGWSERRIYAALSSYHETELGIPIPMRGGRTENARDAFFYLLAFVTLGIWAVALVWLADALVDRAFPSALDSVYQDTAYFRESIAGQLASLIIAFPIFMFVSSAIIRQTRQRPESLESGVRKWLTYIALVIAAITLVGDAVWFLREFLVGDLTMRFILKALAVFVISGGIFWYYLTTMRQDAGHALDRPFGIAASAAAIICVCLGFGGIGSPYYERQLAFDLRRENDILGIDGDVREKIMLKHRMPQTENQKDPETDKPYVYRVTGKNTYTVCATFDTDRPSKSDSDWTYHKAGNVCFNRDVSKPE